MSEAGEIVDRHYSQQSHRDHRWQPEAKHPHEAAVTLGGAVNLLRVAAGSYRKPARSRGVRVGAAQRYPLTLPPRFGPGVILAPQVGSVA
jgi:hypothetical protein